MALAEFLSMTEVNSSIKESSFCEMICASFARYCSPLERLWSGLHHDGTEARPMAQRSSEASFGGSPRLEMMGRESNDGFLTPPY